MTNTVEHPDSGELVKRLAASVEAYKAMPPIERAIHDLEQRRSGVRGLSKMSTPREVIDAHLDKQPEYVVLAAYQKAVADIERAQAEIVGLREALKPFVPIGEKLQAFHKIDGNTATGQAADDFIRAATVYSAPSSAADVIERMEKMERLYKAAGDYCDGKLLEGLDALALVDVLQELDALSPSTTKRP
jgi:hypothetical protein